MNDRYDPGYGGDQYELVGYDEYGRPVYRQTPDRPGQSYDPYAQQGQQGQQQGYGYDPYATGAQQPAPSYDPYDAYGTQGGHDTGPQPPAPAHDPYDGYGTPQGGRAAQQPYDPYGQAATSGRQPRVAEQTAYIPQQAGPPAEPQERPAPESAAPEYRTEQFAFVEEPTDDSEDVIDWLKFTENRTERREEARRRARSRVIALVVVLALVAAGGVGYLWYAGKLPGLSSSDSGKGGATAAGAQKRDVIAVHLHDTKQGGTSTVLLVDNTTTKRGTAVLLPNSLGLTGDDGTTTTLAKSVDDAGPDATRTALDSVLGTAIEGTWRLDTPYLQILVDLVGNIEVDTDTDVPDPEAKGKGAAPLVRKGDNQTLSGKMAVAYATHHASGESANAQLERFGQVMQGVLRKLSSDPQAATTTIQTLGLILDPPLTDKDLGSFLAGLADHAKGGDFGTELLPVEDDGSLSAETGETVVKDILGGTAKSPDKDAAVSVSVQNATGVKDRAAQARVVLLNGGFTFLEGGTASAAQPTSKVLYADAADKENATEVAKTLGLPAGAVAQGKVSANANVAVVLGQDYEPAS
ncbi:LytR C-terminal domain-containing protein [Streptomyces sp. TRM S81-3]|uniref:LytR C-terminal domain-containing protein n=1 Tax=Streptomyces griseicoloratus TaxID=2752516 RepID=A0A926LE30_9ACTN|nr:LytR C-terminal domain-containing protein [Streptomyces griseicoloratus]MBD0425076.1 LytR C-terminal domain-containing protein [Streptomyces griseicoloratus]